MHPAPSVIFFTTFSGLGFGYLAFLAAGFGPGQGPLAFASWVLGYGFAVGGLLASVFHLGQPTRAWRAFSQWRSSWLSREGVASVAALFWLAPLPLAILLGGSWPRVWGALGAVLCLATVFTTSMIYAQLRTVPRWNQVLTPLKFLAFSLAGGALLAGQGRVATILLVALGLLLLAHWLRGDGAFARAGASMGSATGLGGLGALRVFEQPHSHPNYLMREMIHVVARRHATKLRVIAFALAILVPLALVTLAGGAVPALALASLSHLSGAIVARWLFFAEAEHVVGLYYGAR